VRLHNLELSTGRKLHWHPGGRCAQLMHQYKQETIGWRSCC